MAQDGRSLPKPSTAAALLTLIADSTLSLDAPVAEWLPERADPQAVRTPQSPLADDVEPAAKRHRFTNYVRADGAGGLPLVDAPDGEQQENGDSCQESRTAVSCLYR